MILATSSRNGTCKFANTDKDGEVAHPYQYEPVDEASRSATVIILSIAVDFLDMLSTYFVKPIEKILP
jgi:hypothetical protein